MDILTAIAFKKAKAYKFPQTTQKNSSEEQQKRLKEIWVRRSNIIKNNFLANI